MFCTAPAGVLSLWCLRVASESTSAHQCPACACGQKTTLRAPRWRSSRASAPHKKTSPAAQRNGGHRRVVTRKTTGDLATRRGAGDSQTRAEWMTVSRYGHLRSAQVVVDACLRTEREPPTLRAPLWDSTCFGASSMAYCLSNVARTRLQGRCSAGHRDAFSVTASVGAPSRSS